MQAGLRGYPSARTAAGTGTSCLASLTPVFHTRGNCGSEEFKDRLQSQS